MSLTQWLRLHLPVFMHREDFLRNIETAGTIPNLIFKAGVRWSEEQHRRQQLELIAEPQELRAKVNGNEPPPEAS